MGNQSDDPLLPPDPRAQMSRMGGFGWLTAALDAAIAVVGGIAGGGATAVTGAVLPPALIGIATATFLLEALKNYRAGTERATQEQLNAAVQSHLAELKEQGKVTATAMAQFQSEFLTIAKQVEDSRGDANVLASTLDHVMGRLEAVERQMNELPSTIRQEVARALGGLRAARADADRRMQVGTAHASTLVNNAEKVEVHNNHYYGGKPSGDPTMAGGDSLARLHQLRSPTTDFTGRQKELDELLAKVGAGANISGVQGMGGVGKTELARMLAHRLMGSYPDAQFLIELRGTDPQPLSAADALRHVIQSMEPTAKLPEDVPTLRSLYLSLLHERRAIILADNAAAADQVRQLLPPAGCLLLVTTRRYFAVEGLTPVHLDCLEEPEAIALLRRICPRIGDHAAPIARACGCLPLALRAAASFLSVRPDVAVPDYVKELADERKRLDKIGTEGVEIGVEASLNLSYRQLPTDAARVLRLLSVFPGSFDALAEEAVCQDEGHQHLGELLRYGLIEFDEKTSRYHLHDLVRLFAARKLSDPAHSSDRQAAEHRHAVYYVAALKAADDLLLMGNAHFLQGLSLFDDERTNIEVGHSWAARRAQADEPCAQLAWSYPGAGPNVLSLRLHPRQLILWLESALVAARHLKDPRAEGVGLGNLGLAYTDLGDAHQAIECHQQQLAIARRLGDRPGEGTALGNLGIAYADVGDAPKAIECHQQALVISRQLGDRRAEGQDLGNLGIAYACLGQTHEAIECHQQSLVIARQIGNRHGEGNTLGNLGIAYADLGETRKAIECYQQQLAIAREIGDRRGEGKALGNLGNAYTASGEIRRGIELCQQAMAIAREISNRRGEGTSMGSLGFAYLALGETRKAIECHEQYLAIARETGDRLGEGNALSNLGVAHKNLGEIRKAIELCQQSLVIAHEIGNRRGEINALGSLAIAYVALGEIRRAVELCQQRLTIAREIGDRRTEGNTSFSMAIAMMQLGQKDEAIILAEQALALFRQIEDLPSAVEVAIALAMWRSGISPTPE